MFGAIAVLFFVPWLDTSKVRSAVYHPWYRVFFWLFAANTLFLGWIGAKPADGIYVVLMQISTVIYFAFFLVAMPVLGLVETPRRLPNSITEAVLSAAARNRGSASKQGGNASPQNNQHIV
ncbi:Cytochrome b/c1 [Rhizobiaceae bacterium]|nr:Cytochrome b/c1 [Rhizobiaceae bacterium]